HCLQLSQRHARRAGAPGMTRRLWLAGAVFLLVVSAATCAGKTDPTRPPLQVGIEDAPGLHLDPYRPIPGIGPLPAVVPLHSRGFVRGGRADLAGLAEALAFRGYVTVSIDYRLSQGSFFPAQDLTDPGLAAAATLAREDSGRAIDWLRSQAASYRVN